MACYDCLMISETHQNIIVQSNVTEPILNIITPALEQAHRQKLETASVLEDKEKKGSLDFKRISLFLDMQVDENKVFLLSRENKSLLEAAEMDCDYSDGFYSIIGDFIVVYFSEAETTISLEQKIVHELVHKVGLQNAVISQRKIQDGYYGDVSFKRLGFALANVGVSSIENHRPGLLLEEMAASYAGFAYIQKYADETYRQQVDTVFAAGEEDLVTKQLGKKYALLSSRLQTMGLVSLYAFLFDSLRIKLGMDENTPVENIVRFAISSRQDTSSIRQFIRELEKTLGKGSYSKLRAVDISSKRVNGEVLQEAINLIVPEFKLLGIESKEEQVSELQPEARTIPPIWEDETADPTERAVSFVKSTYNHDNIAFFEPLATAIIGNRRQLPDHLDPDYVDKLIGMIEDLIVNWVTEVTAKFPQSDPERVRQEIETIIKNYSS
ncbi:hypothetical protein KA078_00025 [Candidatus Woesebacteria bacterium]|nr:hypothetical protein [Candidatus Woesebacteria bacterium]